MPKMSTIIVDKITIGFFQEETARDEAFEKYIVPNSNNCMKGTVKVGI